MASSIDEYVLRIGRTGRVGNNGKASSLFDPQHNSTIAGDLVKILEGAGHEAPQFLRKYTYGGGRDNQESRFGGRDVRKDMGQSDDHFITSACPAAFEEDEDWS